MLSWHLLPMGASLFWASFSSSAFLVCAQLFHTSRPSSGFREFGSRSSGEVCGCGCGSTSATWTVWAYERKHFRLHIQFNMQQLDKRQESHNTCSPRIPTFCNTPNKKLIQGMQLLLSNLNCYSKKNILHSKNSCRLNRQIYLQLTCHSESPLKSEVLLQEQATETTSPWTGRVPPALLTTAAPHPDCPEEGPGWTITCHWHTSLFRLSFLGSIQQAHRIHTFCSYHWWWVRLVHL